MDRYFLSKPYLSFLGLFLFTRSLPIFICNQSLPLDKIREIYEHINLVQPIWKSKSINNSINSINIAWQFWSVLLLIWTLLNKSFSSWIILLNISWISWSLGSYLILIRSSWSIVTKCWSKSIKNKDFTHFPYSSRLFTFSCDFRSNQAILILI